VCIIMWTGMTSIFGKVCLYVYYNVDRYDKYLWKGVSVFVL